MTGLPCYAAVDGYGLGDVTSTDVVRYAPADIDCAELEVRRSWLAVQEVDGKRH